MTNIRPLSVFVMSLLVGWAATFSQAAIYLPPGLNPGDTYHLAFVTRDSRDATSSAISDYNAFVQAQAALNPSLTGTDVGVTWKAIASTPDVDARDNALVGAPVYLLDGTKIADGFSDMWDGDIDSPLLINQFTAVHANLVWTGSSPDGTSSGFPLGGESFYSMVGLSFLQDYNWVTYYYSLPSDQLPVYALSGLQTVPASTVPEAASVVVWLCLASVLGLVGAYRRWTA